MLQQDSPDDFVIGTGEGHTVREFCREVFAHAGLEWEHFVEVDPRYFRPTEVEALVADASKARSRLGWEPTITFSELVTSMVESDLAQRHDIGSALGPWRRCLPLADLTDKRVWVAGHPGSWVRHDAIGLRIIGRCSRSPLKNRCGRKTQNASYRRSTGCRLPGIGSQRIEAN
jgi:hypothetical protein